MSDNLFFTGNINAVLLDFDGVIADTMQDNFVAWQKVLSQYNASIDRIEYLQMEGSSRFQIANTILKKNNLSPDLTTTIVQQKDEYYSQNNRFRIYDCVIELLDFLHSKKIKTAMVTGAGRQRLSTSLSPDFLSKFDIVVTSDDVTNHKPHPEPYQKAIAHLGVLPESCVVVENAPLGVASAKAAGCSCFALTTTLPMDFLQQADKIFDKHSDLLSFFRQTLL